MFVLALLGASTQCVADCMAQTQQKTPPCHQHSAPEPCKHSQLVAYTQNAADQLVALVMYAAETPAPSEIAWELVAPETPPPDRALVSFSILRL
ncbi:MAG: hypothetical protein JWO19_799 [Bryobacterales bacterium]|nr:hypothetical protein [Bryobacterales bacterium]